MLFRSLNSPLTFDSIVNYTGLEAKVSFKANRVLPVVHYEAEDATLSGTLKIEAVQAGFSGSGYVSGFNLSKTNSLTFNVTVPASGLYNVTLRYAAGSGSVRPNLILTANNTQMYTLKTANTKDWNTWGSVTSLVSLQTGLNTLSYSGDSVFVALDCIDLSLPASIPYQTQSRISRIRQLDGSGYVGINENGVSLMKRDTVTRDLLWKIEKIKEGIYKITSASTGQLLTTAGTDENAVIFTSNSSDSDYQKWEVADYGNVFAFTSVANKMNVSSMNTNAVVQKSSAGLLSQRWVFEDTTVVQYNSLYEPFDYATGRNLNDAGDNTKGWGGPWKVFEGLGTDMTISDGVASGGLARNGNKLTANLSTATALRAYRDIYPGWTDDGRDVWVSFLMDINNPGLLANSWQGLSLYNGSAERILFGKNWGHSFLGLNEFNIAGGLSSVSAFNLPQTWIVALIKMSGNNNAEQAYMWINPDPGSEPAISTANAQTTVQLNGGFNRIVCHLGNTAGISVGYDEIRLGRSFSMVSNPPTGIKSTNYQGDMVVAVDAVNKVLRFSAQSEIQDILEVSVFDANGRQLMKSGRLEADGHTTFSLSYSHLPVSKGVYLISVKSTDRIYRVKVVF